MANISNYAELNKACVGCGLCEGAGLGKMHENDEGFLRPEFESEVPFRTISKWCPVLSTPKIYDQNPWGRQLSTHIGWSTDSDIRNRASSGGIITSLLLYCFDRGIIDGVLQIGPDPENPLYGSARLNVTPESILSSCGSRYVTCSSLAGLGLLDGFEGSVAVVGRPCEIRALTNYLVDNQLIKKKIALTLSFFCAGIPSRLAAGKLLEHMGVSDGDLKSFSYRGNGWPGAATAYRTDGSEAKLGYEQSWGDILGRDIEAYCKFCFDGVGEYADISAGDAWLTNQDGGPSFEESLGRNVVFARTEKGEELLMEAAKAGYVSLEGFEDWDYLNHIQKAQYERKCLLSSRLRVMRLLAKKTVSAEISELHQYSELMPMSKKIKSQLGLVKRIAAGRIDLP